MTETKHTQGPWEISQEPPRWIIQTSAPVGKKAIAFMVGDYVECGANARLIAAAPDLLDAVQRWLHSDFLIGTPTYRDSIRELGRAALAKASAGPPTSSREARSA